MSIPRIIQEDDFREFRNNLQVVFIMELEYILHRIEKDRDHNSCETSERKPGRRKWTEKGDILTKSRETIN